VGSLLKGKTDKCQFSFSGSNSSSSSSSRGSSSSSRSSSSSSSKPLCVINCVCVCILLIASLARLTSLLILPVSLSDIDQFGFSSYFITSPLSDIISHGFFLSLTLSSSNAKYSSLRYGLVCGQ
jgi:hypothetical protein